MFFLNRIKELSSAYAVSVAFILILMLLDLVYLNRIDYSQSILLIDVLAIITIFFVNSLRNRNIKFLKLIYFVSTGILILFIFKQLFYMVDGINAVIYDQYLIQIDQLLFGINPSEFLIQFANPFITEVLQISYSSYYLLPFALGIEFYLYRKYIFLDYTMFLVLYGFYLSYLGYFLFPAIGPRFFLTEFSQINEMLPGMFFTDFIRNLTNSGEGLFYNTLFPIATVQRDAFPSGHTDITLIVVFLAFKLKSRFKFIFLIIGILILISIVYLWYHYVIDLIAGTIFMIFTVWSGKYIFNGWQNFTKSELINFKEFQ